MTHHHNHCCHQEHHEHGHCHNHDHNHDHHHHHDIKSQLSDQEKLIKLLEHWITHNLSHKETYQQWAQTVQSQGITQVSELLVQAADMTLAVNEIFEKARSHLQASS